MKLKIRTFKRLYNQSLIKFLSLNFIIALTGSLGIFTGAYYFQSGVSAKSAQDKREIFTYLQSNNQIVTYRLTSGATSWTEAEAEAVSLGGHLVAINDQAEQTFINDTFLVNQTTPRPLWIGLNDVSTEGTFVWSSGEPVTYINWSIYEPNNDGNEDYGTVNWKFTYYPHPPYNLGDWNDTPNNGTSGSSNTSLNGPYFGIIEIGGGCSFTLGSTSAKIAAAGGTGSFSVSNSTNCTWTAASNAAWLTTNSTGTGNGIVSFAAAANTGAMRTGIITVGNQTLAVTQGGNETSNARKIFAADGLPDSRFGSSVAISGDTAVVGAPETRGPSGSSRPGAAYVFTRNTDGIWALQQKLMANGGPYPNDFGSKVAISGNTVIVSSVNDEFNTNTLQGAAYVFTRTGTSWMQQQRLTANDGAAYDQFGSSIAMTENTIVIGANGSGSGAGGFPQVTGSAYVFTKTGATWTQQQKLMASDGALNDLFGASVGISGETIVVGAYLDDVGANTDQGSTYIFVRNGATWSQQQKLTAANGAINGLFGRSVAIDGNDAVIGETAGSFVNGRRGAAYVFSRNGNNWTQQQKLISSDELQRDSFGTALAISNGKLFIGASTNNVGNNFSQGSLYIFLKNGAIWTQQQKIIADDGASDDNFGSSTAVSGNDFIVGAFLDDNSNLNQGSAYIFKRTANNTITPLDFDGDFKTDIGIFRPSGGEWWINRSSNNSVAALQFGSSTDRLAPADYTGDGKTDVAFFRPSTGQWFILRSENNSFYGFPFGTSGDVPVPADYDGDGKTDAAVFRPATNAWYVLRSSDGAVSAQTFGASGDQPVVADYDGDSKADIAIFRPSTGAWWILKSSNNAVLAVQFGQNGDKTVQADYTGDGKTDIAFWRPANGFWYILRSEDNSFYGFPFGAGGDLPIPGDYDGDGKSDAGVFRSSNSGWYLNRSTGGTTSLQFGTAGDFPIPNSFVR